MRSTPVIVGCSGLAGSGKDAVADFLVANHGFVKVAMADPLKRICREVYPHMTEEHLWGPSSKRNEPIEAYPRGYIEMGHALNEEGLKEYPDGRVPQYLTARYALQQLGTEWGRDCYGDTWVDYALNVANKLLFHSGILRGVNYSYDAKEGLGVTSIPVGPRPRGVVISDVRFHNEVAAIKKANGKLVRLLRGHGLEGAAGAHTSETQMKEIPDAAFDRVIDNREWTLQGLEAEVDTLVRREGW